MNSPLPELKQLFAHKGVRIALKWSIAIAVCYGLWQRIYREREALCAHELDLQALPLAFSALAFLAGLALFALVWRLTLVDQRCPAPWRQVMPAYFASHLGKFIPAKVFLIVIRNAMLKQVGLGRILVTTIQEHLLILSAGALMAAGLIIILPNDLHPLYLLSAIGAGLGFGICCLPPVQGLFIHAIMRLRGTQEEATVQRPSWLHTATGLGLSVAAWLLWALSLHFSLQAIDPLASAPWLGAHLVLAVSLATVGGIVSMIPSGLGAREYLLVEVLSPVLTAEIAIIAAILLRLVWIGVEGVWGLANGLPFWLRNKA